MGRPRLCDSDRQSIHLYISPQLLLKLNHHAGQRSISRSQLLRQLINALPELPHVDHESP